MSERVRREMEIETDVEGRFTFQVTFAITVDPEAETVSAEVDVAKIWVNIDEGFFVKVELGPEAASRLCRIAEGRILHDGDEFDAIAAEIKKLEASRVEHDAADFHCSTPEVLG